MKIADLREIMNGMSFDYFVLRELNQTVVYYSQFLINEYEVSAQKDGDKNRGGLSEFVRKGFICRRLKKLEPKSSDHLHGIYNSKQKMDLLQCLQATYSKKIQTASSTITQHHCAKRAKYDFSVMGSFNIDVNLPSHEHENLEEFCNLFNLSNLIKSNTCFAITHL